MNLPCGAFVNESVKSTSISIGVAILLSGGITVAILIALVIASILARSCSSNSTCI